MSTRCAATSARGWRRHRTAWPKRSVQRPLPATRITRRPTAMRASARTRLSVAGGRLVVGDADARSTVAVADASGYTPAPRVAPSEHRAAPMVDEVSV